MGADPGMQPTSQPYITVSSLDYFGQSIIANQLNKINIITGKCDLPTLRDESIIITSNTEGPLIGGITISYSCSQTWQTISGSNISTCMDNGHWEPDPMDTSCIGI